MASARAIAGAIVVTGVVVVAAVAWLGVDPDGAVIPSNAAVNHGQSTGTPAASAAPRAEATASSALLRSGISFDLHPIGPLDPEEVPVARIVGEPEVVSVPSPFDRSLRMSGATAGICVAAPALQGRSSSIAFDLLVSGATSGGSLGIGLAATDTAQAGGYSVELARLDLAPEGWYRLTAASDGSVGILIVADRSGRSLLQTELAADASFAPTSAGERCLWASLRGADASVLVDDLQVDRR